jgi:hypothetical protein
MKSNRNMRILLAGLQTAHDELTRSSREEYPRDYGKLYSWLEDKLYSLYGAIGNRNLPGIKKYAGEIIITASEMIEFADAALTELNLDAVKEA